MLLSEFKGNKLYCKGGDPRLFMLRVGDKWAIYRHYIPSKDIEKGLYSEAVLKHFHEWRELIEDVCVARPDEVETFCSYPEVENWINDIFMVYGDKYICPCDGSVVDFLPSLARECMLVLVTLSKNLEIIKKHDQYIVCGIAVPQIETNELMELLS